MLLGIMILALVGLAFLHFIADGIIAPSGHMCTRIELFTRAEELEQIARRNGNQLEPKVYKIMRSSLHNFISGMGRYSIANLYQMRMRVNHDEEFREQVKQRMHLLESCQIPEVQQLRDRVLRLADVTLCWNSVGWLIYILPVAIACAMYQSTHRAVKALLAAPNSALEKFFDESGGKGSQSQFA